MKTNKQLGIWMDHASAHILPYPQAEIELGNITSAFTHAEKESSLSKSEHLMHNKEQGDQTAYYKQLGELIKQYDEVLLFGPTDAKTELLNILRADHLFEKITIAIKQTDKMTEHQEIAFVKEYFSNN